MNKQAKSILAIFLLPFLLPSCSKNSGPQRDLHGEARQAAETYYNYLINKQYTDFASGIYSPDSIPADYASQLTDAAAQYAIRETDKRGGLMAAHAIADSIFKDSVNAYVNLELTFGDNTQEEIALPLILTDDGWKMK